MGPANSRRKVSFGRWVKGLTPILISLSLFLLGTLACAQQNPLTPAESTTPTTGTSSAPAAPASEGSQEAAAKDAAQNPVTHVISIPLQNNTAFNVGPYQRPVNELLVEPVIPFRLTNDWILITRTITPLIYLPRLSPTQSETFGLGNINPQFYVSPAHPGSIIWGVGPQVWLPTATDKKLG